MSIDLTGLVRPHLVEMTKRDDNPNAAEFRLQPLERGFGYTLGNSLRRFEARQPLCGIGVTSLMPATSIPVFWMERMAVSRPEPGPFTSTSTLRTPCSIARRAAASAAIWAAKGVDFRDPLNPTLPAVAQEIVFPSWSVIVTIVLLNDDLMWATP
jgi:hypothetical protein